MKNILLTSFTVNNAADWKANYYSPNAEAMRARAGMRLLGVYQAADDANHLTLLTEVDDLAAVKGMMSSPEFAAVQQRSGVTSPMELRVIQPLS